MSINTIIYIIVLLIASISIAFFQYFFKVKSKSKINKFLFLLKTLSLFFIGILLINPTIKRKKIKNIKPSLFVLIDNSQSIKYFKEEKKVKSLVKKIKENKDLKNKFDIDFLSFGNTTQILDSLSFDKNQTDIYKTISFVENLKKNKNIAILLLTDGNQTIGNNYEFIRSSKPIFPIVIGDTTKYLDLRILQINVNKYSYINNKFPIEIFLFYYGNKKVNSILTISKKGKIVFKKKLSFTKEKNTKTITTNLFSDKEGIEFYKANIQELKNEKNIKNNYKNFSIHVLNEQTKVLILSSIIHPDLGAYKKAIESNKQRKVDIKLIDSFKGKLSDYKVVIFYQPNSHFKEVLKKRNSNYLIVTGIKTDWNFINKLKKGFKKDIINDTENYQASFNSNFLPFLQKNIDFDNLPPLKDYFGEITFTNNLQTLLFQKVLNIKTKNPLIAFAGNLEDKYGVIFGQGIWKWRIYSYKKNKSFEDFDNFISNSIQYLSSNEKRKRLEVNLKRFYSANSNVHISAIFLDNNLKFDNRAKLKLTIINSKTKEKKIVPMSLLNTSYQVNFNSLQAGNYSYKVSVDGQNINSYGRFKVDNFKIEEQFTNANDKKLLRLAENSGGKLFYKDNISKLFKFIINDKRFFTTQKYKVKFESLINWKFVLFLIVFLLSLEWFIRKYYGKI